MRSIYFQNDSQIVSQQRGRCTEKHHKHHIEIAYNRFGLE